VKRVLVLLVAIGLLVAAPSAATASADAFSGSWTAIDDDGSTLMLLVSAANPTGVRHVTLVDQYATTCAAPATAIGTGTASGTTLTTTADVRCGGQVLATDVPSSYELVGDTLVIGGVVFTRTGSA
jgi:hypothetical protein